MWRSKKRTSHASWGKRVSDRICCLWGKKNKEFKLHDGVVVYSKKAMEGMGGKSFTDINVNMLAFCLYFALEINKMSESPVLSWTLLYIDEYVLSSENLFTKYDWIFSMQCVGVKQIATAHLL